MSSGTQMTDSCPHCAGRFAQNLPKGAPRAQARFAVVLELHDPELARKCFELHLHGQYCGKELIETVRFAVDPLSRETCGVGPAGVRIIALYEKPLEWPGWPELYAVKGSALPGEYSTRDRLVVGAYLELIRNPPPYFEDGQEVAGVRCVFRPKVPIAAMWTYPVTAPERK